MDNQTTAPSQQANSIAPVKNPSGKLKRTIIFIIIFAAAAYLIGGFIWAGGEKLSQQKACTQEAKQCPDGSFVDRTGPNCEFSACSATSE